MPGGTPGPLHCPWPCWGSIAARRPPDLSGCHCCQQHCDWCEPPWWVWTSGNIMKLPLHLNSKISIWCMCRSRADVQRGHESLPGPDALVLWLAAHDDAFMTEAQCIVLLRGGFGQLPPDVRWVGTPTRDLRRTGPCRSSDFLHRNSTLEHSMAGPLGTARKSRLPACPSQQIRSCILHVHFACDKLQSLRQRSPTV